MKYMPFTDDQQPFYSDERENLIFRVKDAKDLIEKHMHLEVTKLSLLGCQDNPELLKGLYEDLMPERVWYLQAIFATPEGIKEAEVFLMLKDRQLSLPKKIFPRLQVFLSANRELAKQDIPPQTLDYILTLEEIISDTWGFWRKLLYSMDEHPHEPVSELVGYIRKDMNGVYKSLQRVNFLSTSDEQPRDPFEGGI